jgi:cysteinyl-tRNA synthetase
MEILNVKAPDAITRVTEHIEDIIEFIAQIESNGYTYVTEDGVYFDTLAFGDRYGKMAPPSSASLSPSQGGRAHESGPFLSCLVLSCSCLVAVLSRLVLSCLVL